MKEIFLFTTGLILGILIGLNAKPNGKSEEWCLNENDYGAFYKKKRYHA